MLKRFLKILEYSFETYQDSLILTSAKFQDEKLFLETILHFEDEEDDYSEKYSVWEFICSGVRQQKIVLGDCLYYDLCDENFDHVLKWKYTKPLCSVSFYGKTENPLGVIGGLYDTHIKAVGDWIPFNTFLNMSSELENLISGGFGLLAENVPEPLAIAYENTLKKFKFSASHTKPKLVSYWNGEKRTTDIVPIILLILGESEIITEKIEAKEISSTKV